MRKFYIAAAMVLLLAVTRESDASPIYAAECDGCSTQQKMQLALGVLQDGEVDEIYVYSLAPFGLTRYAVEVEMGIHLPIPLPNEPQVQGFFNALHEFYVANGNSLTIQWRADIGLEGVGASAISSSTSQEAVGIYEFVQTPALHLRANNQLRWSFSSAQATLFSALNNFSLPHLRFDRDIFVRVELHDGHVYMKYNYGLRFFEVLPETARDSSGNKVPLKRSDFVVNGNTTIYIFDGPKGGADYINFIHQAWLAGVPINGAGGAGSSIACVEAGGQVICHVVNY